jgi:uncharacterized coiled-coil protein SlyX
MSEFTPITTQEELNKVIEARLARQKESIEAKYPDYDQLKSRSAEYDTLKARNTELETQNSTLQAAAKESKTAADQQAETIAELNTQVADFQRSGLRTKIALKNGLPYELADRLAGDDEASIQADAERLASFVGGNQTTPPLKGQENSSETGGAYQSLLNGLNLEGE